MRSCRLVLEYLCFRVRLSILTIRGFLTLRYQRARVAGSATLSAEVSGDLKSWSSAATDVVQALVDDSNPLFQIWEARDMMPKASVSERFMRLRAVDLE